MRWKGFMYVIQWLRDGITRILTKKKTKRLLKMLLCFCLYLSVYVFATQLKWQSKRHSSTTADACKLYSRQNTWSRTTNTGINYVNSDNTTWIKKSVVIEQRKWWRLKRKRISNKSHIMELERHWINGVTNEAKRNKISFHFHLPENVRTKIWRRRIRMRKHTHV